VRLITWSSLTLKTSSCSLISGLYHYGTPIHRFAVVTKSPRGTSEMSRLYSLVADLADG
jgi:hypothetical protein